MTRAGLHSQLNCQVRVCVKNTSTQREKHFKVWTSQRKTLTSELNLIWQTPHELAFLFSGEVSPELEPIRALWTWSICNKGVVQCLSVDFCGIWGSSKKTDFLCYPVLYWRQQMHTFTSHSLQTQRWYNVLPGSTVYRVCTYSKLKQVWSDTPPRCVTSNHRKTEQKENTSFNLKWT